MEENLLRVNQSSIPQIFMKDLLLIYPILKEIVAFDTETPILLQESLEFDKIIYVT